jgi:hypothetical protein
MGKSSTMLEHGGSRQRKNGSFKYKKPKKIEGVAAPRQQGPNDQTHRDKYPFPKTSDQENKIQ